VTDSKEALLRRLSAGTAAGKGTPTNAASTAVMSTGTMTDDTHTVTTTIDDDLRHALATAAAVDPRSVRVVDASAGAGELTLEIEGAEL